MAVRSRAQARFLLLHVRDPGQIGFPHLGTRLLLMIGQDMSGLIDQCIGIFDGRPQSRRTLQGTARGSAASAVGLAEGFFLFDTSNGVADLRQSVL